MALRRTPLFEYHKQQGATFTDFGGWEMPVSYDSIRSEHRAVREAVGVFDVSHMGEIEVRGPEAGHLCQRLTTNNVLSLAPGEAQYTTATDENGHLLDDLMLYRLGEAHYLFVPNAGNDESMTDRWEHYREEWELDATVTNLTEEMGMIAVQGPAAKETVAEMGIDEIDALQRNEIVAIDIDGDAGWLAGTGYTGENGCELLLPWSVTAQVTEALAAEPCGLGARDTLRLEMGYVLAGNEFDQADNRRTPLEARLDFIVDLESEPSFVGQKALIEQRNEGVSQQLVGVVMEERGVPRAGYPISTPDGEAVGQLTSGTVSPSLGEPIGLGYVDVDYGPESSVTVSIRDTARKARIVTPPFLKVDQ